MHISSRLGAEDYLHRARGLGGYGYTCPHCRQTVELKEDGVCPICGHRAKKRGPLWKTLLFYLSAMVIILLIAGLVLFLL